MLSARSDPAGGKKAVKVWRAKDGGVPLYDDPTLHVSMFRWERIPDTTFEVIHNRVLTGQISKADIDIAVTLANALVLTEKQVRHLYGKQFRQEWKLASRLRYLQQIGWFEGWRVESEFNQREYIWSIGIAAKNLIGYGMGMDVPDPLKIAQNIKGHIPICAINEMRIQLIERKVLETKNFSFHPNLAPDYDSPLAIMEINTPMGKLVMYVERLHQSNQPKRFMEKKLRQYVKTVKEHGSLYNPFPESSNPILVWSCGTEEAIQHLVGSLQEFPTEIMQLFVVDEHLADIRKAWRMAVKGNKPGEVTIKKFDMDFL